MIILIDSREKYPWTFAEKGLEVISKKLDTGDYSIEGMEKIVCIERKRSISEWSLNLTSKRFFREIERMVDFKWKFILLEFSIDKLFSFPDGANLPPKVKERIKVRGPFLVKKTNEIMIDYGIPIIFAQNKFYAEEMCYDILKRIY